MKINSDITDSDLRLLLVLAATVKHSVLSHDGLKCPPLQSGGTFSGNTNPVEISGELFRNVGFPSGRESNHHYHGRGVRKLGYRR